MSGLGQCYFAFRTLRVLQKRPSKLTCVALIKRRYTEYLIQVEAQVYISTISFAPSGSAVLQLYASLLQRRLHHYLDSDN